MLFGVLTSNKGGTLPEMGCAAFFSAEKTAAGGLPFCYGIFASITRGYAALVL